MDICDILTYSFLPVFDRYTHRIYDVVPLELVKNLPDFVMKTLTHYAFIIVEAGKASDFTDKKICSICEVCVIQDESVQLRSNNILK